VTTKRTKTLVSGFNEILDLNISGTATQVVLDVQIDEFEFDTCPLWNGDFPGTNHLFAGGTRIGR